MSAPLYTCRSCHRMLPRNVLNFHKDPACRDGLKTRCRECRNQATRARYAANAKSVLQRQREARQHRAEGFASSPQWQAV